MKIDCVWKVDALQCANTVCTATQICVYPTISSHPDAFLYPENSKHQGKAEQIEILEFFFPQTRANDDAPEAK